MEYLNPRAARVVALTKPIETERGQWYFHRYVTQLPTAREIVLIRPLVVQPRWGRAGDGLLASTARSTASMASAADSGIRGWTTRA